MKNRIVVIIIFILLSQYTCNAEEFDTKNCTGYPGVFDTLPCNLRIISWVEVYIQSDLLKKDKDFFEKLIRLRLKNDLSMYKHETKSSDDLFKESMDNDDDNDEGKNRGEMICSIWTVGDKFPIAYHIECELSSMSVSNPHMCCPIRRAVLGISSENEIKNRAEEMLRSMITDISVDLIESRERVEKAALDSIQRRAKDAKRILKQRTKTEE